MKKLLATLLISLGILPTFAIASEFANIDEALSNNALHNVSNRYISTLLYFFPEQTTRMGFTIGNHQLNTRTKQQELQAIQALHAVDSDTGIINEKALSKDRQIDFDLIKRAMAAQKSILASDRLQRDPLYYAGALDSIFDLYLRTDDTTRQRNNEVLARLRALPGVVQQAKQNLSKVSQLPAQLAMEKAYYAMLSIDEMTEEMISPSMDEFTTNDLKQQAVTAKETITEMFEFFKTLSQQENSTDFRLGKDVFSTRLQQKYQIDTKLSAISKELNKQLNNAQHNLWKALLPFETSLQEEITIVEEDGEAVTQSTPKKTTSPLYTPPSASQFYKIAQTFFPSAENEDVLSLILSETSALAEQFSQDNIVYPLKEKLVIKEMPSYYAYSVASLFIPAEGFPAFFLRLPTGNALNKSEMLEKEFNTPMRKVMISREIFPGRYYQEKYKGNLGSERHLYQSPTLQNGWGAFALKIAQEHGFLTTPQEQLAAEWSHYLDAVNAILDFRLQTQEYDYATAWNFLVNEQGFPQEQAEEMIRQVVAQPGNATSTVIGENAITKVYNKYLKKLNNRFTHADLVDLFVQVGNVPPADLEAEIKRVYNERSK